MTRQEALHELYTIFGYGFYNKRVDEALSMAIKALEQKPKRGKWLDRASELDASFRRHDFVCLECAHKANYFVGGSEDWWDMEEPNYCPNCGVRMEVEEK